MKKIILSDLALALQGSPARAEIELDLGGYFRGYAGFADQSFAGVRDADIHRKSKIFFEGSNAFSENLTVGLFTELFQENGDDHISASYLYFEGGWGHVKFG